MEDQGSWQTYYPGAGLKHEPFGNRGRAEVRGVDPSELLAKHAEYVETFRRERGLAVRPATLAEVANATLTYARAALTKQGGAAFLALPLGMFALPAGFSFAMLARESEKARLVGALGVIFMALFYAVFRYGLLTLTKGWAARHAHTREFELEQTAVASDGSIVPGRYERWVRVIAMLGVADMVGRLVLIASKSPAIFRLGSGGILMAAFMAVASVSTLLFFIRRIRGRAIQIRGKSQAPTALWSSWAFLAWWMNSASKNEFRPSRLIWLGVVVGLAALGWWLEKRGRK